MEEILINVDSRYRDILINPNECKFKFNLQKTYKNIISVKMKSVELNNSATFIDSVKKNNFITVHLPNKTNDPQGIKLELEDGLYQTIGMIQNVFNGLFNSVINTNDALQKTIVDGKIFAEKYFYIFYLNENVEFIFDFNSATLPSTLQNRLTIEAGWHSIYGLVLQIQNYISTKYDERRIYKLANPTTPTINFDNGNFILSSISLPIFDRRFRSAIENDTNDCIRYDTISSFMGASSNLTTNLGSLKTHIYQTYIYDIITFIAQTNTTYDVLTGGILDQLNAGEYLMPANYTISEGTKLDSRSKYHIQIVKNIEQPTYPTSNSIQIYNLLMNINNSSLKVSFINYFTLTNASEMIACYYYYSSPAGEIENQTWSLVVDNVVNNVLDNLFSDKQFLLEQKFITQAQYDDPFFEYSSEKDIASFDIDFSTYEIPNPIVDGLLDVNRMVYPPVGYYLGFRPDTKKSTDSFLFSGTVDGTERTITGSKIYDTNGEDYVFLKINDWGYLDFFGRKMFAKILLTTNLGNPTLDDYINKEYRFRQPIDLNRLDIELVDYLGNTINLGGFDWSFTLEINQMVNSSEKSIIERNNLIFSPTFRR
jgi:hypothetical protein